MRNLKRALSLALASVMVLGMMVVGAGAASFDDFSDKDKIVNAEAVSVLNTLNVINGKEDGSFDPTGIVTRAEMAKMICVVLNGGKDPNLGTSATTTYTDTANNWAAGYIEFCTNQKIVSGDGTGKFNPTNTVTGQEAAKMILVAMGYDATYEKMTGASWATSVNVLANKNGLYDSLTINPNAGLSRDDAAQMLYNALDAEMVYYDFAIIPSNGTLDSIATAKTYDNSKTILTDKFGAVKVEGTVVANEVARLSSNVKDSNNNVIGASLDSGKTTLLVNNYEDQNTYKDVETTFSVSTGIDMLGRAVTLYVKPSTSSTKATVVGSPILSTNNVVVTDASGDSINDVADDNNLNVVSGTQVAHNYASLAKLSSDDAKASSKTGVEKILIDNDNDGDVDYVLLNTYEFGKVTAYSSKDKGSITVKSDKTLSADNSKDVVGFDDVAKNDYVLAAFIGGKLHVEKAEEVTGNLDAYKSSTKNSVTTNSSLTVDGTSYDVSKVPAYSNTASDGIMVAMDGKQFDAAAAVDTEATFYLDKNGYIVAVGDVSESAYAYAYVIAASKSNSDGLDSDRVKVTLEDGTTGTYYVNDKSSLKVTTGNTKIEVGKIYAYSITSDGEIKMSAPSGGLDSTTSKDGVFNKGKTTITGTGITTAYATSNTVFFYQNKTGDTVNVYTGYQKAPSVSGVSVVTATARGNKLVAVAFQGESIASADVSDHMFIYKVGNSYADYTEVTAYLAGKDEPETIKVSKDSKDVLSADTEYLYTTDSDDYYVLSEPKGDNLIKNKTVDHASATTFVVGGNEYKVLSTSVLIDNTDDPGTPTAVLGGVPSIDDNLSFVLFNKDNEALMIVVDNTKGSTDKPTVNDTLDTASISIDGRALKITATLKADATKDTDVTVVLEKYMEATDKYIAVNGNGETLTINNGAKTGDLSSTATLTPGGIYRAVVTLGTDSITTSTIVAP